MCKLKPVKAMILVILPVIICKIDGLAQQGNSLSPYRKFPIVTGVQFQNFAMPFRDMGSNFTHPGIYLGSEIYYNEKGSLFQQAVLGGYLNREIGNGIFLNTQIGYRPAILQNFYGEVKAGIGVLRVFHPSQAYKYENGEWQETIGGKTQLTVPIDFGLGYSLAAGLGELSPFISYQIIPSFFYNTTLPINLYTNFLIGLRVKRYK